MGPYTSALWRLTDDVFTSAHAELIRNLLSTDRLRLDELVIIDRGIGGPSLDQLDDTGSGRYDPSDRDVFRPLQYLKSYFVMLEEGRTVDWLAREMVHMSALHLETLVKRAGRLGPLPLGTALGKVRVRNQLGDVLVGQVSQVVQIYNAAKHHVDHPMDTHLFSVEDGILSYLVCRKLGSRLIPLCALNTPAGTFV